MTGPRVGVPILVLNAGSSSLKYQVLVPETTLQVDAATSYELEATFDLSDSTLWPELIRYRFTECVPVVIGSDDDF